jgi:TRAP-type C4-dicarboxylate transport system substrate-binding protein
LWTQYEQQAFDKMKASGIDVVRIADKTPFQDAVRPVWEKYGPKYAEMIKRIQDVH